MDAFTFLALAAALVAATNDRLLPGKKRRISTSAGIIGVALLVTATWIAPARAQENQPSLETVLAGYIAREVRVSEAGGSSIVGSIASIHDGALELSTVGGTRTVPLESILRVDRYGDSVKNGFLIGAVCGAAAGFFGTGMSDTRTSGWMIYGPIVGGAVYGLIGAGIDGMHTGWTPLYVRRNGSAQGGTANGRPLLMVRFRF